MEATLRKANPQHKWVIFISVALCIAAVGISSHFFELRRKEREKRIAAENRLETLRSELELLEEKNRELAEQLREAKRVAEELAREKEEVRMAAAAIAPAPELPGRPDASERTTMPQARDEGSLTEAVDASPLERVAVAASGVKESAGRAWNVVRAAIAASARSPGAQASSASPEGRQLADVKRIFTAAGLGRLAADAKSSARKALNAVGSLFSFDAGSSAGAVYPGLPVPFAGSRRLTATNEELREQLADVRREKRELEMEIAERTGKIAGSVDVGRVRITTGRRFSGKVLVVNRKYDFLVIDIGKNQGLEKGEVLIVHRGSEFIGKAQVIKVYEKMAAADLVTDWMQSEVQVNDGVKKF